ncbi:unnamed protein product [Phytophthora lilii]|uniref:Unnamed protein product n=1 Tax=Phytophthora lilii TaxID=2077276 RepID=A0A9W6TAU9_9STRA|nr:unnamed protein product [Phytophthora lilii]
MPPTLPRELGETAFGASGASQGMPGHDAFGSQASGPKSQNGFGAQQQQHESVPPSKPEGMSAFDSLSTVEDAPLPSLASSTPRSSRANSFNHTEATASTSHAGGFGEPSVPTPTGSLHGGFGALAGQQDSNNFGASRTPSVTSGARSERTNSASSMNSMSSFSGMAPLPPQVPQHQLPPRNLGSNERIQMPRVDNAGFQTPPQAYSGFGAGGFGAPQAPVSEKPFMGDDDEKSAVRQLDQQNEEVVQTLANVERKQTAIEMLSDKLRDLDELRHELVTLVMKREDLRVFSATASATTENYEEEQTRHAVEHSLRSLVENQKQFIHQLQCDISRHEGELEEAILSAKLQQKLSLESRSPLINATSPRQSIHDSLVTAGGEANAFTGAPLSLDGANALPSPIGAPSAPSVSAFSADATDSSGFNAFSNFDSAPRSIGSATPSPAAGVTTPSGSPFSPTPSPSQSASANTFGDFAAAPLSADATPDVPAKSPAAASDAAEFDAFGAAPISASSAAQSSSPAATSDVPAISPFSPFSPSPSPAATDDSGFGGFGDFNAAPSASPAAAIEVPESSPFSPSPSPAAAAANSSSGDFGSTPDAVPSSSPTTGVGSSPFSSSPSLADVDAAGFEAFVSAPLSSDSAAPPAEKANATENLIFSPVAPDSSKSNAFGDFSADPVSASSATSAEPTPGSASTEPPTGNLLFSPEPSPAAATSSSGFDAFGDFGAPPASTDGVASAPADKSTGSSPFSPAAVDNTDFNGFGDFNAASTSADSTSPSSAPEKQAEPSGNSPFSPAAEHASNSGFEAFGDFNAAPVSTDAAATPSNLTKAADASGSSPFSPVAADNSGFDGFGDFNSASATTATSATTSETTKPAESSGNSPFSPVATDNSGFEAFGDFNAAPSTTDSKPANSSDSNSFEAFGDFNAAPTATDNSKSAKDSSDSPSFAAFGDFSAAPSSTSGSDAFGDFK